MTAATDRPPRDPRARDRRRRRAAKGRRLVLRLGLLALCAAPAPRLQAQGAGVNQASAAVPPPTEQEAALLHEFSGAYPEQAPRSTGVKRFTIRAAPAEVEVLEGRRLAVWSYNGQVPGPTLRLRHGQTLRVRLVNGLPQPTTIHWHGVRVPNAMDGVPHVTQEPVEPGGEFVYEFTPKDAGTYWYHPHVRSAEQVERGLYGVLVVEDATPAPYSRDVVWVLDDWRLTSDGAIDPNFVTRGDLMHDGRWGNVVAVNGRTREVLEVGAGERIRLRLVNSANGRVFVPGFPGLDPWVIAVDGLYVQRPFRLGRFELAPGNRLDLDIVIPREQAGQEIVVHDRFLPSRPHDLARLRVGTAVGETPRFDSPARARVPEWRDTAAIPPRLEYVLQARAGGPYGIEWTMNGRVHAHDRADPLRRGEWAKIRYRNDSYRLHPMHIHGQFFKLLSRNGSAVHEPFWRDTVLVHGRESVEIGLVPLDAGRWMLHCHVLEHAEAGMMTLVEVEDRPPAP